MSDNSSAGLSAYLQSEREKQDGRDRQRQAREGRLAQRRALEDALAEVLPRRHQDLALDALMAAGRVVREHRAHYQFEHVNEEEAAACGLLACADSDDRDGVAQAIALLDGLPAQRERVFREVYQLLGRVVECHPWQPPARSVGDAGLGDAMPAPADTPVVVNGRCGAVPVRPSTMMLSARELATAVNQPQGRVEKFLERFRKKNKDCYQENDHPRLREPRFFYLVTDVWPALIAELESWQRLPGLSDH
jgi:hypothetical protein